MREDLREFLKLNINKKGIIANRCKPSEEYGCFYKTGKGIKVAPNNAETFILDEENFICFLSKNDLDLFDDEDDEYIYIADDGELFVF